MRESRWSRERCSWARVASIGGNRTARRGRALLTALLGIALLALLSACSSGTNTASSTNYTLILDGSTADHPAAPPTIAANGPSGTYAFVYDNQIWLRHDGDSSAKQLTHLELSNGATLAWGPLAWSHSGKYIAFALVEDLNLAPGTPSRTAGPLYYVDTSDGNVMASTGTGSIYGHTYTWIGDSLLLYSDGSGLMLYTLANPRAWQVRDIPTNPGASSAPDYLFFGDVATANGNVYYTRLDVKSPGQTGVIGTATLVKGTLGFTDNGPTPTTSDLLNNLPVADTITLAALGDVYTDANGDFVAGEWRLRAPLAGYVVQQIDSVDSASTKVSSSICVAVYSSCDSKLFTSAAQQAATAHPQLAVSSTGAVAYTADGVYIQGANGKQGNAGWMSAPVWSPDGHTLVVTQLVSQTTDAGGVTRFQTNVVTYAQAGGQGTTLIAGGSNLAWAPA